MAGKCKDFTDRRFGRLTVIERAEIVKNSPRLVCRCDCGNTITVYMSNLGNSHTSSCGCLLHESRKNRSKTHGMRYSAEYSSWMAMKMRCTNPNKDFYEGYGGRGIKVCEKWMNSFESFYKDMGKRPDGTTLDRIDVNGDYEPSNCRWATSDEQGNNKRTNHPITYNGRTHTLTEWSKELEIPTSTILNRLKREWPIDKVFSR